MPGMIFGTSLPADPFDLVVRLSEFAARYNSKGAAPTRPDNIRRFPSLSPEALA